MATTAKKKREKVVCPSCLKMRGKSQGYGVLLLLITVAGCGLPGPITIPLMVYMMIKSSRRCEVCRQAKQSNERKS